MKIAVDKAYGAAVPLFPLPSGKGQGVDSFCKKRTEINFTKLISVLSFRKNLTKRNLYGKIKTELLLWNRQMQGFDALRFFCWLNYKPI